MKSIGGAGGPQRDVTFLASHPLFRSISPRSPALDVFLRSVRLVRFARGETIYAQREAADALYLVRDGEVHIEHTNPQTHTIELIGIESRGAVFGEASLLSGEPRSSDARAALDSNIYVIPGDAFLRLLHREGAVSSALALLLSRRLRERISGTSAGTPAKVVALLGPLDALRSARIANELADQLAQENRGRVVLCAFNGSSGGPGENSTGDVGGLLRRWPQVTIAAIQEMLESPGRRFDVMTGESLFLEAPTDETLARIPELLGRLRTYYAVILIDMGADYRHPVLSRLLGQCDRVVLVRPVEAGISGDDRDHERWRACAAACTDLVPDFFERVITVSDEAPGIALEQLNLRINRASALYRRHIWLRADFGNSAGRPGLYLRGLRRLARHLNGTSRGLCLGGGGARAFAHVGVIEVLEREGIDFDAVAGTSMGAIIGAWACMGHDAHELREGLRDILPTSEAILDKTLPLVSFFRGRRLNGAILRGFGRSRFEDLELPFYCNGADLNSGRQILFESGFLATALRASVSLPGVFPPLALGNMKLIDGGVINNLPGDILRERGHSVVIGVNVTPLEDENSATTTVRRRRGPFGFLRGLLDYLSLPPILNIVYRSITMEGRELIRFRMDDFDQVLEPNVTEFGLFDFHRIDEIIERGRREAELHLDTIREVLRGGRGSEH